jgi:hypothetical protein
MKLRWVEREETVPASEMGIEYIAIERVLQYWDSVDGSPVYGRWVDVPLEVE